MPTLTDKNSLVCQALVDLIGSKWDDIGFESKEDVFYGDQTLYPRFPACSVEPAPQDRTLNQTGLQQRITFTMFIMVYHGGLKNPSLRLKDTDELTERVIDVLHTNRTLNGLVIHGLEISNEPGFAAKGGALLVANRITWEGISNFTVPKS